MNMLKNKRPKIDPGEIPVYSIDRICSIHTAYIDSDD